MESGYKKALYGIWLVGIHDILLKVLTIWLNIRKLLFLLTHER